MVASPSKLRLFFKPAPSMRPQPVATLEACNCNDSGLHMGALRRNLGSFWGGAGPELTTQLTS